MQTGASYKMFFGYYPSCHQWQEEGGQGVLKIVGTASSFGERFLFIDICKRVLQLFWMLFYDRLENNHATNVILNQTVFLEI